MLIDQMVVHFEAFPVEGAVPIETGKDLLKGLFRKPGWQAGSPPKIGVALGGGFARGVAHVGLLRVLERNDIPVHCITGVSAGAIVAAAYASGSTPEEIGKVGCAMRFSDVARWTVCKLGLAGSERMSIFLRRLLKSFRFEDMQIPLGIAATDLCSGKPVSFRDTGEVVIPIRASCSYPGLFCPVAHEGRLLVDGAMSMEVPAQLARSMGATHVISACIPIQNEVTKPGNMLDVINRCFQIMMLRTEESWRRYSDAVIVPDVATIPWDGFANGEKMIAAGEAAAEAAMPTIRKWLQSTTNVLELRPSAPRRTNPNSALA